MPPNQTKLSSSLTMASSTSDNLLQGPDGRPEIRLKNGLVVIGTVNETYEAHTIYHAYRGIPFAVPPLGELRFKPPVPLPKNLTGYTIDASQDKSQCVQMIIPALGSEDCLYINVYTPAIHKTSQLLPVMMWIHGGGFVYLNNSYYRYGPDFILEEDVIFVSVNYRLGVFGWLTTDDKAAPGNYGLKDQILALHWIKDNIESFGGNSSRVTISGQSAGAVCASYLSHTSLTKGLFQSAIFHSGTSINLWSLTRNKEPTAYLCGDYLKINATSSEALVDALRKVDYRDLAKAQFATAVKVNLAVTKNILSGLPYGPTVEPDHSGAVVTNHSYEQLRNGLFHRIPYLMGFNSQEILAFEAAIKALKAFLIKYYALPNALVPASLNIKKSRVKDNINSIIKSHYFGNNPLTISDEQIIQFLSDDQFNRPIIEAGRLYSAYTPVYFYEFDYKGSIGSPEGVSHSEELHYLFKRQYLETKQTESDLLTRKRLVKMWTNFIKTGNPTPTNDLLLQNVKWPLANVSESFSLRYLSINRTLKVKSKPKWKQFLFWVDLFEKYGNPPFTTY
ncbi:hypothetical protein FQR65_LT07011 [Abscondita terminalis]|nr:hypothetical protein FQR65_LT07011 [Abscondita terminalis]